jgi:hypothetical protein
MGNTTIDFGAIEGILVDHKGGGFAIRTPEGDFVLFDLRSNDPEALRALLNRSVRTTGVLVLAHVDTVGKIEPLAST